MRGALALPLALTAETITVDPYSCVSDYGRMKPYSEDLRTRIVRAVQKEGRSKSAAARLFDVSLSSVKRYVSLAEQGSSLTPRKGGGRPPKTDETTEKLLEEDVKERPWATVSDRHSYLKHLRGKSLSVSTVRRLLKRMGFSQKNGQWGRWNETSS